MCCTNVLDAMRSVTKQNIEELDIRSGIRHVSLGVIQCLLLPISRSAKSPIQLDRFEEAASLPRPKKKSTTKIRGKAKARYNFTAQNPRSVLNLVCNKLEVVLGSEFHLLVASALKSLIPGDNGLSESSHSEEMIPSTSCISWTRTGMKARDMAVLESSHAVMLR